MSNNNNNQSDDQELLQAIHSLWYYKDESKNTYVEVPKSNAPLQQNNQGQVANKNVEFISTESEDFENYLADLFVLKRNRFISKSLLKEAIRYASSLAKRNGYLVNVALRFGYYQDNVYVDMANNNGDILHVVPGIWGYADQCPVKFTRNDNQLPLMHPDKNGDLKLILKYVNLPNPEDQMLFLVALTSLPINSINRPILSFTGPEGSCKTTAARFMRAVWDPTSAYDNNWKSNQGDLAVALYNNAVPLFDNLSKFPKWVSDSFCRAVTGGGLTMRKLYTNGTVFTIKLRRPIILTALNIPSAEGDFLDRCLKFKFNRIKPEKRKGLFSMEQEFASDLPKIIGGCLDALAKALEVYPTINLPKLPRMADFAAYGAAIAEGLGYDRMQFIEAFFNNVDSHKSETMLQENPLADAVIQIIDSYGNYEGQMQHLWNELQRCFPENVGSEGWPKNASGLGRMLSSGNLEGIFTDNNIKIELSRNRYGSNVKVFKEEPVVNQTVIHKSVSESMDPFKLTVEQNKKSDYRNDESDTVSETQDASEDQTEDSNAQYELVFDDETEIDSAPPETADASTSDVNCKCDNPFREKQ